MVVITWDELSPSPYLVDVRQEAMLPSGFKLVIEYETSGTFIKDLDKFSFTSCGIHDKARELMSGIEDEVNDPRVSIHKDGQRMYTLKVKKDE